MKNERGGKLRLKKSWIDYPITSFQMFRSIGLIESALCAISLIRNRLVARLRRSSALKETDNYESYLVRRAGRRAYRLFYEPYARKVWGGEPASISTTAVKKRISMLSPTLFLKDMVAHYAGRSRNSYYYYIQGGMSGLAEGLAQRIRENQGEIRTGVNDFRLRLEGTERAIAFPQAGLPAVKFETLISTIPVDELLLQLNPAEEALRRIQEITWRGLRLVFLHVEGEPNLKGESFYFPELGYPFGRVSVPKRFDPAMQPEKGETALTCEVACSEDDGLWKTTAGELASVCLESLRYAGLIAKSQKPVAGKDFVVNLPKIYPVYRVGWEENISRLLLDAARRYPFVYSSGKPGLFLHDNIDHSMEIGLTLVDDIAAGASAEDWVSRLGAFHNLKLRD
jgi:protoporphyrinogen oxidase